MPINKVVYGTNTVIDLTADTVDAQHLKIGYTAHDRHGAIINGADDTDSNTQDATAIAGHILDGDTAYVQGVKVTGTMPNNGAIAGTIDEVTDVFLIPNGYHEGSSVQIDNVEKQKIIASNIKNGISLLGVVGSYGGGGVTAQSNKNVTPTRSQQVILPDSGYDYLAQVTVEAAAIGIEVIRLL